MIYTAIIVFQLIESHKIKLDIFVLYVKEIWSCWLKAKIFTWIWKLFRWSGRKKAFDSWGHSIIGLMHRPVTAESASSSLVVLA